MSFCWPNYQRGLSHTVTEALFGSRLQRAWL
jgi:hypothetical protein